MEDLFDREQRIFDDAASLVNDVKNGAPCSADDFENIVNEYGRLLRQLRRVTKISDRTAENLNTSKLDLLDKVHYDALTGIYNRRYMEENLNRIIQSLSRSGGTLSVLMIDVDFFKKYNDTYGHGKGDECLKSVAATLTNSITRADDFAARYGGEEFAVVLPNTSRDGACAIARRMLKNVISLAIPHEKNSASHCVTISIGITTDTVQHKQNADDYLKQADEALYESKRNGRNRFTYRGAETRRHPFS